MAALNAPVLGATTKAKLDPARSESSATTVSSTRSCAPSWPPAGRARTPPRPAAWSPAVAPSRGARRAPAERAPVPPALRSGPAVASCSAPAPATTPARSTARRIRRPCKSPSRRTSTGGTLAAIDARRVQGAQDQAGGRADRRLARSRAAGGRRHLRRGRGRSLVPKSRSHPRDRRGRPRGRRRRLGPPAGGLEVRAKALEGSATVNGDARSVLVSPVVSEKSYGLIAERRKYTFKVLASAHKTQVRQAVEEVFGVDVIAVNIIKVQAKPKRRGDQRRHAAGLEEGGRDDRRGPDHRSVRTGSLGDPWQSENSNQRRPAAGS